MSDTTAPLWDFRVEAVKENGKYRVRITGARSGTVRERVGYHPLWELIRLLAQKEFRP